MKKNRFLIQILNKKEVKMVKIKWLNNLKLKIVINKVLREIQLNWLRMEELLKDRKRKSAVIELLIILLCLKRVIS